MRIVYSTALLILITVSFFSEAKGQTFQNVATEQGITAVVVGGNFSSGVSFADFNKDGWDDITIALNNQSPALYLNVNGNFQLVNYQILTNTFPKMIVWVDYDNDGDRDLFMTNDGGVNRLMKNDGNFNFTDVTASSGLGLPNGDNYGASWGDYDLDGDLDVYICNYRFSTGPGNAADKNHLFRNDGNDVFTDVTASTMVGGNVDLSFQSAWIDYNHDLYPDLYVINDKTSPNKLYRNNGNGTFSDVSESTGTDIIIDSMSASYADYNNDLLMDLYSTNTQDGNVLLQAKEDLTFQDSAPDAGLIVYDYTWGAVWFDMDNDTDQDLYIAESEALAFNSPNYLFENKGLANNYQFEEVSELLLTPDISDAYTPACGDFNNDGHMDLIVSNRFPYNAVLWENSGNEAGNGFVKVRLEGTTSNKDGIGSWITVYAGQRAYCTYTLLGEQYISQNTFDEHFGLGTSTQADSIRIDWPSGIVDTYYNVLDGTTLLAVEGTTQTPVLMVSVEACSNEPAILYLEGGNYSSVLWSTGQDSESIEVSTSGSYEVIVELNNGNTVTLVQEVTLSPLPNLSVNTTEPLCYDSSDGAIELFNVVGIPVDYVDWQTEKETDLALFGLSSGVYNYTVFDINGCSTSGTVILEAPEAIELELVVENGSCPGDLGSVLASASGGTPPLDIDYQGMDVNALEDGTYTILASDLNGCSTTSYFSILNPQPWDVQLSVSDANGGQNGGAELEIEGGTAPYNVLWSNGQQGTLVEGIGQGIYFYVIQDANGCDYQESFEIIDLIINEEYKDLVVQSFGSGIFVVSGLEISSIVVFDSIGKKVAEELSSKGTVHTVDLSHAASGTYIAVLNNTIKIRLAFNK